MLLGVRRRHVLLHGQMRDELLHLPRTHLPWMPFPVKKMNRLIQLT